MLCSLYAVVHTTHRARVSIDRTGIGADHDIPCEWCKMPEWRENPAPTMQRLPQHAVSNQCSNSTSYPWVVMQPMMKGGILETYYHYVLEFAVPLSMTALRLDDAQKEGKQYGEMHQESSVESGPQRSGLIILQDTRTDWAERQVKRWGWLDMLPADVTFLHRMDKRVCTHSLTLGVERCNPLSGKDHRLPRAECVRQLMRVGTNAISRLLLADDLAARARIEAGGILFIPREQFVQARSRKIKNWNEVLTTITDHAMRSRLPLRVLCFDGLPLREQLAALRSADLVITQRGSVNANFIVLRPSTTVLLLADPVNPPYQPFYWMEPLWYTSKVTHIAGKNSDPYGVVDVSAMNRELSNIVPQLVTTYNRTSVHISGTVLGSKPAASSTSHVNSSYRHGRKPSGIII